MVAEDPRDADRVELRLPFEVESVGAARQALAARLLEDDVAQERVLDAVVVLSELLMNALVHGGPDEAGEVLAWWHCQPEDGVLDVGVHDGGSGRPVLVEPGRDAAGGRGLLIVDRVAQSWAAESEPGGGTSVRARLGLQSVEVPAS